MKTDVLVAPRLAASASWGGLSRHLAALLPGVSCPSRTGPNGRLRCGLEAPAEACRYVAPPPHLGEANCSLGGDQCFRVLLVMLTHARMWTDSAVSAVPQCALPPTVQGAPGSRVWVGQALQGSTSTAQAPVVARAWCGQVTRLVPRPPMPCLSTSRLVAFQLAFPAAVGLARFLPPLRKRISQARLDTLVDRAFHGNAVVMMVLHPVITKQLVGLVDCTYYNDENVLSSFKSVRCGTDALLSPLLPSPPRL